MMNERNTACDVAVLKTLSYRAVFRYPLSFYQLGTFLLCEHFQSFSSLINALDVLQRKKLLRSKEGKILLKGIRPLDWESRVRDSKRIIEKHQNTFTMLGKIPWIKLLAVTGATAAYNFKKGDDLDIFIVTQKKRLWITRFFVVLLLKSLGEYRTDKNPGGKICPNLLVSESELGWDLKRRDVYVAHEIVMMHPVIDREDMYFRFMKANDWVFKYFGNVRFTFPEGSGLVQSRKSMVLDLVEVLIMSVQRCYMKKKRTVEVTSSKMIHFNRNDSREVILSKYRLIYSKVSKNS